MPFSEPPSWTRDRDDRLKKQYPQLQSTTIDTLLAVDNYGSRRGQAPSAFSQTAMGLAAARPEQTGTTWRSVAAEQDAMERFREIDRASVRQRPESVSGLETINQAKARMGAMQGDPYAPESAGSFPRVPGVYPRQRPEQERGILGEGYSRARQGSLGFFTGSNPLESVRQAAGGAFGNQTFDPADLGFVRNMKPGDTGYDSVLQAMDSLTRPEAFVLGAGGRAVAGAARGIPAIGRAAGALLDPVLGSSNAGVRYLGEAGLDFVSGTAVREAAERTDNPYLIAGAGLAGGVGAAGVMGAARRAPQAFRAADDAIVDSAMRAAAGPAEAGVGPMRLPNGNEVPYFRPARGPAASMDEATRAQIAAAGQRLRRAEMDLTRQQYRVSRGTLPDDGWVQTSEGSWVRGKTAHDGILRELDDAIADNQRLLDEATDDAARDTLLGNREFLIERRLAEVADPDSGVRRPAAASSDGVSEARAAVDSAQSELSALRSANASSSPPVPGAVDPVIPGVTPRGRANVQGSTFDTAPEIADIAPFSTRGAAIRTAEEVAQSQSEAVQRYAARQAQTNEPIYGGIVDALDQSSAAARTDPQGVVSRIAGRVPGLRQIRDWDRSGLTMELNILEGHVARRGVESQLMTQQSTRRYQVLNTIDQTFGENAVDGAKVLDASRVNVPELHTVKGQLYPASGTVYDAIQRPYAYNLTLLQRQAIRAWGQADEQMRQVINDFFGGEIGQFVPERDGTYVQNLNRSTARTEQLDTLARQEGLTITGSGKSKPRVWDSGFDRWKSNVERGLDPERVFVPEVNLRTLGHIQDAAKANAAGDMTFRAAIGGKTISEVKEEVAPRLVELRNQLRTDIDSIQGRINRAEQSLRRDSAIARRLDSQAQQTARQADELVGRDPIEAYEIAIGELDARARQLSEAASGPAGRADLARQGIESLRDDLASLKDQYADVKRAYDAVDQQDFVQVSSIPGRYFPTQEAAQLEKLTRTASNSLEWQIMEGWRSQVLAGDIGPLTGVQGVLLAASGRSGVTRAIIGSLADAARTGDLLTPYRTETMQRFLRQNADLVNEFSFYTGRPLGIRRLPDEIGQGGLLARFPGFTDANEAMFNVTTRRQIEMFKRVKDDLLKAGYSNDEAAAASSDLSSKINPLTTTARLGQSEARAQKQRFLPTSIGFIRQPLALTEEAFTGLAKMATGQALTPRQKLATSIYTQFIGNIMVWSVTSAAINALANGDDVFDAIQDALDPESRAFMALSIGDKRISLANPFRSPLRVGINSLRNILNFGVESLTGKDISANAGDSAVDYATNRLGPPARAILEAGNELTAAPWEREYQGDNDLLRLLSAISMLAGSTAPIPVQGIYEEAQEQRKAGAFDPLALAATATAEFASFSLLDQEKMKALDSKSEQSYGEPFSSLDRAQRRTILAGNPDLSQAARDDVRERMESTGYREATERAWDEMAPEFGVEDSTYQDYRDRIRRELEAEGLDRTYVEQALREDPLVNAYNDLRRGFEYKWVAENVEGIAAEAYDFGLIPDSKVIREMVGVE
jgi:hypothetical protein